jgi:hypothetical protein
MRVRPCAALLVVVAFAYAAAAAEPPPKERRERARTFLVVHLASALNLKEPEALRVGQVIQRADERRRQLQEQFTALEGRIRDALKRKAPDAELAALVTEGSDLNRQISLLPDDSFRELQRELTVEQQAKLLLFRRELQQQLQHDIKQRLHTSRRPKADAKVDATPTPH